MCIAFLSRCHQDCLRLENSAEPRQADQLPLLRIHASSYQKTLRVVPFPIGLGSALFNESLTKVHKAINASSLAKPVTKHLFDHV